MRTPWLSIFLALSLVGLALFPLVGDGYYIRLVTKIMVLGLFAMSLDLLVGYTGLVSFGHAAFFGVGGYIAGALINTMGVDGLALLLPASLGVAAGTALVVGWISIRTSGIYFIMITLAMAQMLHYFFRDLRFWGGADGMNIYAKPILAFGDTVLIDLGDRVTMYYVALAFLTGCYVLLRMLLRSPFGRTLVGIRINEGRMRALGYRVQDYKLVAFVIAGTLAGLAGFLEASRSAFMNPAHLSWQESGLALVIVLLGGMGTLFGPIVGAFAIVLMEDWFSEISDRWLLFMGLFVIAVVIFLPNGIAGLFRGRSWRWPFAASKRAAEAEVEATNG